MSLLIKLKQAVVVEGKYDKITLENIIDAFIIPTDGYSIFKDKQKRDLIRLVAKKNGIIVITDSDSAGGVIRSYLKQICPEGSITNVYVPQLRGKEKRKSKPSKQGYLGVEGLDKQTIIDALIRSGVTDIQENSKDATKITKTDLFKLGLSGRENSSALRKSICEYLKLPVGMSANAFLDCVNSIYNYDEFKKAVNLWQREEGKR